MANAEINVDPVNKMRVSTPQALIDTDFEYGTQVSKWENLALTNNRPFAYANPTSIPLVASDAVTINGRTVTVKSTTTPAIGTPITVSDSFVSVANGTFVVDAASWTSGTSFTYTARSASSLPANTVIFDPNKTSITPGTYYSGSAVNSSALSQTAFATDGATGASKITVTLTNAHGLSIGNEIQVWSSTAATAAYVGSFYVAQVNSPTSFSYYTRATASSITSASDYQVYARAQGSVLHRPVDGGVIFSSNGGSNYEQQIRQTRRYFRYQSGKGIQMSSGTILKPNFQVDKLSYTAAGTLITVTLKDVHNLQTVPPDAQVTISGANEAGFNGTYYISNVLNYNTFTVVAPNTGLTDGQIASGNYYVSTSSWFGAVNRLGIFDQQNGLFFEFDGQTLYAVRRNSTYQLAGRGKVTNGSTAVTNSTIFTSTAFTKQLTGGDFIVIKGQSYRVESVQDDSNFTISPAYRGATADNVTISKTIDTRTPQSQWNLDACDGTGPSGYKLDLSKMQMFYIDFSWYGAGFVRWGLRAGGGNVTYVHKMQNNNVNQEAYLRSGNLPGRYESGTIPPVTKVTAAIGATDTTIAVADTSAFPNTGTLYVKNYSTVEHVYYSGKTATSFINVVRAQAGATGVSSTLAAGSNIATVATTGVQIGQRVISTTANALSDATFVTAIGSNSVTLSQAAYSANPPLTFIPMSASTGQAFPLSSPTTVELGYPTLAPTISHWGTSVIMDGRYDDDKSLLFTYGQKNVTGLTPLGTLTPTGITISTTQNSSTATLSATTGVTVGMGITSTNVPANTVITNISGSTITLSNPATGTASGTTITTWTLANSAALMAIRVAPSVDNGKAAYFGARELINRMQLVLRSLDVSLIGAGNILVQLILNNGVGQQVAWTNVVSNSTTLPTSSLAQIADYAGQNITLSGTVPGEVTGGFFVSSTGAIDLALVRDLGNSILGGGNTSANDYSNVNIYPNGPDVATVLVTNVGNTGVALSSRLSWTEAHA